MVELGEVPIVWPDQMEQSSSSSDRNKSNFFSVPNRIHCLPGHVRAPLTNGLPGEKVVVVVVVVFVIAIVAQLLSSRAPMITRGEIIIYHDSIEFCAQQARS